MLTLSFYLFSHSPNSKAFITHLWMSFKIFFNIFQCVNFLIRVTIKILERVIIFGKLKFVWKSIFGVFTDLIDLFCWNLYYLLPLILFITLENYLVHNFADERILSFINTLLGLYELFLFLYFHVRLLNNLVQSVPLINFIFFKIEL